MTKEEPEETKKENSQTYCQRKNVSCSACCGINNLDFDENRLREYLTKNTTEFININLLNDKEAVRYRMRKEKENQKLILKQEVYVCPFVGWIDETRKKTGCLLHSTGSPHKDIGRLKNPQNYSFYGHSICQSYDCPAKSKNLLSERIKINSSFLYSQIAPNYNLLSALRFLFKDNEKDIEDFIKKNSKKLSKNRLPVDSFEEIINIKNKTKEEIESLINSLLKKESYLDDEICL
ncbi:MAG: hypothetical protein OEZ13_09910 [Spirochaetia bacterium]|nr:hypothetical protein [Spirochaetia bacterium]